MLEISANVNAADVADLNKAIDLMIKNTSRMGKDAVHRAAYMFIRSAKAQTPAAKKKIRKLRENNDAGPDVWRTRKGEKVLVASKKATKYYLVRRQNGATYKILIPDKRLVKGRARKQEAQQAANELKEKYKYKPNMRAAKNSWNKAFRDLGKAVTNTMERKSKRVAAASRAKKLGGNFTPSVNVTNDLSYLTKIAPQLEGNALKAAGKSLLHTVEEGIEKHARKF